MIVIMVEDKFDEKKSILMYGPIEECNCNINII